jgi:hypothetical protein
MSDDSKPRPKRFRWLRKLFWVVVFYAVGAASWPYLRPYVEPHARPVLAWIYDRLGWTSGESELKTTYLARLRIEVEKPEKDVAAFVYVDDRLIGPAGEPRDVFVNDDQKQCRVRVVGLNGRVEAPFSMHETVVTIKAGEPATARLKVPRGSSAPSPAMANYSPQTGSIGDLRERVRWFGTERGRFAGQLQALQADPFWKQLTKSYEAMVLNPPAQGRSYFRDVPVWLEREGAVGEAKVDLELRPAEVRALEDWYARKYELTTAPGALEQMASSLRTMADAAIKQYRDEQALLQINAEFSQVNVSLTQQKAFVTTFGSTIKNMAQLLEEAEASADRGS